MKKKKNSSKNKKTKTNKKVYFSYKFRLILLIIIFIICYFSLIFMIRNSFSFTNEKKINIGEKSNIDYKVYLKENDFYDTPYLDKGMSYVSNLIKNININFNYDFNIDKNIDCDFSYSVIANLLISDANNGSKFFSKEYVILNNKINHMYDNTKYNFNENVNIDYDYYNDLANKFKASYGVNADSKLIVYLKVDKTSSNKDSISIINNPSIMMVTIPLTEKAVNINIEGKDINNYNEVIEHSNFLIDNLSFVIISFILLILSIYLVIKICRMISLIFNKKTNYDKYINKLMKEYDRLIVETTSFPKIDDLNVFNINSFSELLDVRDNIKMPIMYYNVTTHSKCYLYIKNNNDIYILKIKAVDLGDFDEKE